MLLLQLQWRDSRFLRQHRRPLACQVQLASGTISDTRIHHLQDAAGDSQVVLRHGQPFTHGQYLKIRRCDATRQGQAQRVTIKDAGLLQAVCRTTGGGILAPKIEFITGSQAQTQTGVATVDASTGIATASTISAAIAAAACAAITGSTCNACLAI